MAMRESGPEKFEYLRPLRPLHFPEEAEVPEFQRHLELRTFLYQLLSFWLQGRATVGSDQFLYFDASDPKVCLAPDVFLQLGGDGSEITSWKTWERGTPDLAIEIASRSDAPDEPWNKKLVRYHRLGVRELVRFDPQAAKPLRVWDYVEGDLAERKLAPAVPVACRVLGAWWVLVPHARWGRLLRLAHDPEGTQLVETETEVAHRAEAAARQAEAAARQAEAAARQAEANETETRVSLEARLQELEAELQRLRSQKP